MSKNHQRSDISFRVMALIHNNPLRRIFDNPMNTLRAAGIKLGQQVLEVGCGPGFFTIPAAKMVGDSGYLYAIDLHPFAVRMVNQKLKKTGLTNVKVALADAAKTGLPAESIDVAFLFGVIHALPLDTVIPELYRVLKPGGALAVQTFSGRKLEKVMNAGFFTFVGKKGRVCKFQKSKKED